MSVTAFNFQAVPHLTAAEVHRLEALARLFPRLGFGDQAHALLERVLAPYLGADFRVRLERTESESAAERARDLPAKGVFVVLGLTPVRGKAVVEIDPILAMSAIDHLLGGTGEPLTVMRPLTTIEEGIFSYLVLKVLAFLAQVAGPEEKIHFRLEDFLSKGAVAQKLWDQQDAGVVLVFGVRFGEKRGFVKVRFPQRFVDEVFIKRLAGLGLSDEERRSRDERRRQFDFLRLPLWVEAGQVSLLPQDLAQLEEGDVLLFDEGSLKHEDDHYRGAVRLHVGRGHLALEGEALPTTGPLKIRLRGRAPGAEEGYA